MSDPVVDWEPLQKYKKDTVECQCGAVYVSHSKGVIHENQFLVLTQEPCPQCGSRRNPRRVSSPVEQWDIPAAKR
jgi:hypothetical protein